MRQRLIYILKHSTLLQSLYRTVMSAVLQFFGLFINTDNDLVLFVSFMGTGFNDSPKVIYDYMQSCPAYGKYRCVWAFETPGKYPELNTVKIDTVSYFIIALQAKYWISNTGIERGLHFKKKGQIYLNTWHGIPLKYIGNDCPGRRDFDFRTVDYMVVSGEYDERIYKTALRTIESSYLRCGLPRNEKLWNAAMGDKKRLRQKLGLPDVAKIILYAPTWRDSMDVGKTYVIKPPFHFKKWRKVLGEDYIVLFRAHHLTTKILGIQYNEFIRNFSDYPEVNDLMIASDMLITDYSSIAFDYSILGRPIFCYAYDYDIYLAERGTYFKMDEKYPNKVCRTEDELLSRIKSIDCETECANTRQFRDYFIQYRSDAAKICTEALFDKEECKDV